MKIVHVIDSLEVGGTENQLLALLPDLARDHEIVLVTLRDQDRPGLPPLTVARRFKLGFSGPRSLPRCILKLRKIIAVEKPDLVRAQLYWSSIAARLATPRRIPLIFSIHSTMSVDGYTKRRSALWLEKLTYRPHHRLIGVSQHVLDDFNRYVGTKGRADPLINFVQPQFLEHRRDHRSFTPPFRIVAVGNLKEVKNHTYLLAAIKEVADEVTLDIYGEGHLRTQLEEQIAAEALPVNLWGAKDRLWEVLPSYDLFVMPSLHEGCPNAVIEAMAVGLPLILSDIPAMREVSHGNALFFDPGDPQSLVAVLRSVLAGKVDLSAMAALGVELVRAHHSKARYLAQLTALYEQAVSRSAQGSSAI
jgi:glycosyltransferase involved in cell wall biosynthesis